MRTKIIPDNEDSLDDLVVRARSDSELKRLMHPEGEFYLDDLFEVDVEGAVYSMSISPDDQYISMIVGGKLHTRKIDYEKKELGESFFDNTDALFADFFPSKVLGDGKREFDDAKYMQAISDQDGIFLEFFNDITEVFRSNRIHESCVIRFAFSKRCKHIATAFDNQLKIYRFFPDSMSMGECIFSDETEQHISAIAFGNKKVYVGEGGGWICTYFPDEEKVYEHVHNFEMTSPINYLSVDANRQILGYTCENVNPEPDYFFCTCDISEIKTKNHLSFPRASVAAFGKDRQ
jgi:hypothetical protein